MHAWFASLLALSVHQPAPPTTHILDGEDAVECAWPTAAQFSSGGLTGVACAAALIHPQVVVTYSECIGPSIAPVNLGEDPEAFVEFEPIDSWHEDACVAIPNSQMYACLLAEPVVGVPQTPPLFGCESDILQIGTEVALVGFGEFDGFLSPKRWAMANIEGVSERSFRVRSADGSTTCGNGDLGGPVYVQLPDGSWRIAGIISTIVGCELEVTVQRLDHYLPGLEAATIGLDVTPCHTIDGEWAPTEACGRFSLAGPDGGGSWGNLCADVPLAEPSSTCGSPFGVVEDAAVRIASPLDGEEFEPGDEVAFVVETNVAVDEIGLSIDGEEIQRDGLWPYGFDRVTFPQGTYEVHATAYTSDGTMMSESLTLNVGVPQWEPMGSTGDESGSTGDARGSTGDGPESPGGSTGTVEEPMATSEVESAGVATAETGAAEADADANDDADGCGCASDPKGPAGLAWLAIGALAATLRRRTSGKRLG